MLDSSSEAIFSPDEEQVVHAILVYNPLKPEDRVTSDLQFVSGKPLAGYLEGLPEDVDWYVLLNDTHVPKEGWLLSIPKPDDLLTILPIPRGGGGDGKAIMTLVATIGLAIASPYLGAVMASSVGTFGMSTAVATSVWTAAINIAGGLLISTLLPPPTPNISQEEIDSSYGIDGPKNTSSEGRPVPIVYGLHRTGGNMIQLFTKNALDDNGDDIQYLYAQILLSEGPVEDITDIELNDQPISAYENIEIDKRRGFINPGAGEWFDETITLFNQARDFTTNWQTYTTSQAVDRLRFDVLMPLGSYIVNDDGKRKPATTQFEIQYRRQGTTEWKNVYGDNISFPYDPGVDGDQESFLIKSTGRYTGSGTPGTRQYKIQYRANGSADPWVDAADSPRSPEFFENEDNGDYYAETATQFQIPAGTWEFQIVDDGGAGAADYTWTIEEVRYYKIQYPARIRNKSTAPVRRSLETPKLQNAIYEVQFRRTDPEGDLTDVVDKIQLSDVGEVLTSPVSLPFSAWVGVKVKQNGQLSGIPKVTALVKGIRIAQYDWKGDIVSDGGVWSDNPADIVLNSYLNRRYGGGMEKDRIDFASFYEWRQFCVDNGYTFNAVMSEASNIDEAMRHVYTAGRAQRVSSGSKVSVAIDRVDNPVMMFGPGNIRKDSLSIEYLPFADRINDIEITFNDKDNGYRPQTLRISDDSALDQGEYFKTANINLKGITDKVRAEREGIFRQNYNKLISRTAKWDSPLEAIACTVGDRVLLMNEVTEWGYGGRLLGYRQNHAQNTNLESFPLGVETSLGGMALANSSPASGVTLEAVGAGIEDNLPYVDVRIHGTNGSGGTISGVLRQTTNSSISLPNGEPATASIYAKLISGDASELHLMQMAFTQNEQGAFVDTEASTYDDPGALLNGGSRVRLSHTSPTENGVIDEAINPRWYYQILDGQVIDVTIRLSGFLWEQSAQPNNYIYTDGQKRWGIDLDRPVNLLDATAYKLLAHQDSHKILDANVSSQTGREVVISTSFAATDEPRILIHGGTEYRIQLAQDLGGTTLLILDESAATASISGSVEIWTTDFIDEVNLLEVASITIGTVETVVLETALTETPNKYANYMIGAATEVKRPYRIVSIGISDNEDFRELSAVEIDDNVYNDAAIYPTYPFDDSDPLQQVTNVTLAENTYEENGRLKTIITVNWDPPATGPYFGAWVQVSVNSAPFETIATVEGDYSFEQTVDGLLDPGDTITVRVVAKSDDGHVSFADAPTASLVVTLATAGPAKPVWEGVASIEGVMLREAVPSTDTSIQLHLIYKGADASIFDNATYIGYTKSNTFFHQRQDGDTDTRFWVVAVDLAGQQSTTSDPIDVPIVTLDGDEITPGSITSAQLQNLAVLAEKLADGSVTTQKLANLAVTSGKIDDLAIIAQKIADGAISTQKLAALAVTAEKLTDGAITTQKLADLAVTAQKLLNGSVTEDKIDTGAVSSVKLADLAVIASKLADGSITTQKLANLAVTSGKIDDLAIIAQKIADGAISTQKLAALAVTAEKLTNGAVSTDKLADLAVTAQKLLNGAVTDDKLGQGTGRNLLADAQFTAGIEFITQNTGAISGNMALTVIPSGDPLGLWAPDQVLEFYQTGGDETGFYQVYFESTESQYHAVEAGKAYDFSVYVTSIDADVQLYVQWIDAAGLTISHTTDGRIDHTTLPDAPADNNLSSFGRIGFVSTAPTGAVRARAFFRIWPVSLSVSPQESYTYIARPQFCESAPNATQIAPWSPSGVSKIKTGLIDDLAITLQKIADGAISTDKLANLAVTSGKIDDLAIIASKIADGSISTQKLANLAVTVEKITDGAITSQKIANLAITSGLIAAGAVQTDKLANDAVDSTKLANLAVTAAKIVDGSVSTAKLANLAVTLDKIANGAVDSSKIAALAITAGLISDGAVTGPKIGSGAVDTTKLANLAVTAAKLADGSISTDKLAALAVTAAKLADGSISTQKLANLAVTVDKLADGSVNTQKIVAAAINSGLLADNAVTSAKINNGAVGTTKLGSLAVTAAKLADGAVSTNKLANLAVTSGKIADLSIIASKLADGSISTQKLADLAVTVDKLTNGAVTTDKLADLAITAQKLLDGAVTSDKLGQGAGKNLLPDAQLVSNEDYLQLYDPDAAITEFNVYYDPHVRSLPMPDGVLRVEQLNETQGTVGNSAIIFRALDGTDHPAEPGKAYEFSAYVTSQDADLNLAMRFYDDTGAFISSISSGRVEAATLGPLGPVNKALGTMYRLFVKGTAPANTRLVRCEIQRFHTDVGAGNSYTYIARPMFAETVPNAVEAQPWSPSGLSTIKTGFLDNGAITTDKLGDLAVTLQKIADGSISTAKLADLAVTAQKLVDGAITTDKLAALAVTVDKITDGAISTQKIANLAITAGLISNGAVENAKIANDAVDSNKLANLAVTAAKLADGSVGSAKLAALAVTAAKIADGAISDAKLANLAVTAAKLANGAVTTQKIANLAITSGLIASGAVQTDKLDNNAVDSTKLADLAVTAAKLVDGAVTTQKIANLAITSGLISSGAVQTDKLANSAVDSTKLADLAVTAAKLVDGSVNTAKLANLAVTLDKLADASVDSNKLGDLAVTAAKLAAGAVTSGKIANGAVDLLRLAVGFSANMLDNSQFINGTTGISFTNGDAATVNYNFGLETNGTNELPFLDEVLKIEQTDGNQGVIGFVDVLIQNLAGEPFTIEGGKRYELSFYASADNCDFEVYLGYYNNLGQETAISAKTMFSNGSVVSGGPTNGDLQTMDRIGIIVDVPTGARGAVMVIRKYHTVSGQSSSVLRIARAQFAEVPPNATELSPWAPGIINRFSTANIIDGVVTTPKIADANITTAKIADANVTTAKVADSNITRAKLASASVHDNYNAQNKVWTGNGDAVNTENLLTLAPGIGSLFFNETIEVAWALQVRRPISGSASSVTIYFEYRLSFASTWGTWITLGQETANFESWVNYPFSYSIAGGDWDDIEFRIRTVNNDAATRAYLQDRNINCFVAKR